MPVELPPPLARLRDYLREGANMVVTDEYVDRATFGNIIVLLQGRRLSIRIVCDRGEWSLEVSGQDSPDDWYDIALIHECLSDSEVDEAMPPEQQATLLREHWETIRDRFAPCQAEQFREALEKKSDARGKRWLPEGG